MKAAPIIGMLLLWGSAAGTANAAPPAKHKPHAAAKPNAAAKSKPAAPALVTPATAAPVTNTWALLVGVSKYQTAHIGSLRFPADDATALRDALVDPQLGNIARDHVRLLVDGDATRANILDAVDNFLKPHVQPGDHVLLFLAGHGVTKGVNVTAKGFLLPTDVQGTTTAALEEFAIDFTQLSSRLSALPASQFIVFVDACREDPTPGRGLKANTLSDILSRGIEINSPTASSVTFFACSIGQRAFEDPALAHGVFTYWILDGIKNAALAEKPAGAINMGRLANYVTGHVEDWAKKSTDSGQFEVEQTPQIVSRDVNDKGVILMNVHRPLPDAPLPAGPATLTVSTSPEGAIVSVNGQSVGAGTVTSALPQEGLVSVKVAAPGYKPVETSLAVLGGYGEQVTVALQPGTGDAASVDAQTIDYYNRAVLAEAQEQWEVAAGGYSTVISTNPKFAPAYERLADLQERHGQPRAAITTLVSLLAQAPDVQAYSALARLDATYAESLAAAGQISPTGDDQGKKSNPFGGLFGRKRDAKKDDSAPFTVPNDATDAALQSLRAAHAAVKQDANAPQAQAALGFALVVTDRKGSSKDDALAAFGRAVFLDPKDAANHYGLGYGLRFFAALLDDESARNAELQRAVVSLKTALALRPDYYEAHRELAFCYHVLGDTSHAMQEYEVADAHRESADTNDVAAYNCALASLHQEEANKSSGSGRQQNQQAADAYLKDAREIQPDLTAALATLGRVGLLSRLRISLPSDLQRLLNLPRTGLMGILELSGAANLSFPKL